MKSHFNKALALILCIIIPLGLCACGNNANEAKITDVVAQAQSVAINGKATDTVEARLGAFQGKQGDYIEFFLNEPTEFNTLFIAEKTATIRQYNIFAKVDGKYQLIHTGKNILNDNIYFDAITATAIKVQIVNTEIGNDNFVIQGISAYNIPQQNTQGE